MKISIVGSGYVGLSSALGFASKGHTVVCIDVDQDRVNMINQGELPFYNEEMRGMLSTYTKEKDRLKATTDYEKILDSEAIFICVGTPTNSYRSIDLTYVKDSAKSMGQVLKKKMDYYVVVVKSTVVPGVTEETILPLLEECSRKKTGKHFGIAVNPEFLQEGRALSCFLNPDRIIIGQYDRRSGDVLEGIYRDFTGTILRTDIKSAEMIKVASNAFLATKISFINEIGNLCKKLGIDVYQVAKGMGYDPRIGNRFLNAGIGFGGSCLPKDLEALAFRSSELGVKADLLNAVSQVNKAQRLKIVDIAQTRLGKLENKKIAVLGLAFKPDTEDIRHSPAIDVIHQLLGLGAQVKAYDPLAMAGIKQIFSSQIQYGISATETIADSDCTLILTEWDEFKNEDLYCGKVVIDGRRVLEPQRAKQVCSYYEGVCW